MNGKAKREKKQVFPNNSVLYAIRKKIGDEGIRPRPFLDNVFKEIDSKWDNEWSDEIFNEITKIIDDFFK